MLCGFCYFNYCLWASNLPLGLCTFACEMFSHCNILYVCHLYWNAAKILSVEKIMHCDQPSHTLLISFQSTSTQHR